MKNHIIKNTSSDFSKFKILNADIFAKNPSFSENKNIYNMPIKIKDIDFEEIPYQKYFSNLN